MLDAKDIFIHVSRGGQFALLTVPMQIQQVDVVERDSQGRAHLAVRQTAEICVVGDHRQDATAGLVDPILTPPQEFDEVVVEVMFLLVKTRFINAQLPEYPAAAVTPTEVRVGWVADDDGHTVREQGPSIIDFVQDVAAVCRPARGELSLEQYFRGPATSGHDINAYESPWQYVAGYSQPALIVVIPLTNFSDVLSHAEQKSTAPAGRINDAERSVFAGQAARNIQLVTKHRIHTANDEPHNRLRREVAAAPSP